ncbi:acyltransferase [Marivita sp. S6314]|uniref:acyltransferase family protein n=1 Tax=Marivita sp. S6314 TaxID=2926406 RepID=UPI001FF67F80|nr:acyltransferase [Marivita sp. S6314]
MSKITTIQVLRGVAATLVAGHHLQRASLAEGGDPGLFQVFDGGAIGVDIFFVISGFIIFYVSTLRPAQSGRDFIQARFWRIVPPYWAILTLYVLAATTLAYGLGQPDALPDLRSLIVSYLLLPYPDHVIIIAWTLAIELLFYALFAATFFGRNGTHRLVLAMGAWILASQVFLHAVDPKPLWLVLGLHSAVLEFLLGIWIAMLFLSAPDRVRQFRWPALILGGTGVGVYLVTGGFVIGPFGREIAAGLPSALLVCGALGFSLARHEVLETWGESSYILYLLHLLYFSIAGTVFTLVTGQSIYHSQLWMVALLISVTVISYGLTVWVERPYQAWTSQRRKRNTLALDARG